MSPFAVLIKTLKGSIPCVDAQPLGTAYSKMS